MRVIVDGNAVVLDNKNVAGSGGEGTVYKAVVGGQKVAIKVYEKPTRARADKLIAFQKKVKKFTDRVIAPESLVYDTNGLVIGFTMPLVTGNFHDIGDLASKKFRRDFNISTKDVTEIFLDGIPTLSSVNAQGFVVGDLSAKNELFRGLQMLWWDVDCWQFDSYPCPVATESYLDPALYGINLSLKPVFSPGNDWYSFAVLLFRSLLLVHPYGGTHRTLNGIPQRAIKRVTAFDSGVTYPTVAISPDILTDEMLDVFESYFHKGQRNPFPTKILTDYLHALRECTSCGAYFPVNRGNCPICSAKAVILVQQPIISTRDVEVMELIRVDGQVLMVRVLNQEVRVVANEKGRIVLYSKKPGVQLIRKELFGSVSGSKYEMTQTHLFVNFPGEIDILTYDAETGDLLGKLPTRLFASTRKAAFRASDEHLFRIDGVDLKCGRFVKGVFEERTLRRVMEDQTWFWVDQTAYEPSVFGLFQVVRQQMFWMIKEGKYFDVAVPQLEQGESLLDVSVKFSSQGACLLRKTQLLGKDYLRQEVVDNFGKVIFSNKVEEVNHPYPGIHGLSYGGNGIVLHPTDEGVVQEKVLTGEIKPFPTTKNFVDGGDALLRYGNSILVAKQNKIVQITLK